MLRFVTVDNFKSFRERVSVPIGHGVNVVAGENGAGKSNLLDAVSFALGEVPANLRVKTTSDLSAIPGRKVEVELQFELAAFEVLTRHDTSAQASSTKKKAPGVLRLGSQIVDGCRYYLINGARTPRHRFEDAVSQHLNLKVGGQAVWRISQSEINKKVCLSPSELFDALSQVSGTKLFNSRREEALKQCSEFKLALDAVSADLSRLQAEVETDRASVTMGERRELLQLKLTNEIPVRRQELESKLACAESKAYAEQAAASKMELAKLMQALAASQAEAASLEASAISNDEALHDPSQLASKETLRNLAAGVSAAKTSLCELEHAYKLVDAYRASLPEHATSIERHVAKKASLESRAQSLRNAVSTAKSREFRANDSDESLEVLQEMESVALTEASLSTEAWNGCKNAFRDAQSQLDDASKELKAVRIKHDATIDACEALERSIKTCWQRFDPSQKGQPSSEQLPTRSDLEAMLRDCEERARLEHSSINKLETVCMTLSAELRCWLPAGDEYNAPGKYLFQGVAVKDGEGNSVAASLDAILSPHIGVRITNTTQDALAFVNAAKKHGRGVRVWPHDRIDRPTGTLVKRRAEFIKKVLISCPTSGCSDPSELFSWDKDDTAISATVAKMLSNWILAADDESARTLLASKHGAKCRIVTKNGNQHSYGRLVGGGCGKSNSHRIKAAGELKTKLEHLTKLRQSDVSEAISSLRVAVDKASELECYRAEDHVAKLQAASLVEMKARAAREAAAAALSAAAADQAQAADRARRAAKAVAQEEQGGQSCDSMHSLLHSAQAEAEAAESALDSLAEEEDMLREAVRPKDVEVEERLLAIDKTCLASDSAAIVCPWNLLKVSDAAMATLLEEIETLKVELEALLTEKNAAARAEAVAAAQADNLAQKRHEDRSAAQKLTHTISITTANIKALQASVASLDSAAVKAADKAAKSQNSAGLKDGKGSDFDKTTVKSIKKEVNALKAEENAYRDELRALKEASAKSSEMNARSSSANRGTLKAKVAKVVSLEKQMTSVSQAIQYLETGIEDCIEVMRNANHRCFDQVRHSFAMQVQQLCSGKTGTIEACNPNDLADGLRLFITTGDKKNERKSSVLELSGGQKALVGLALTFALSAHSRLPLYILDEIDAPLDEHNQAAAADAIAEVFRGSQVLCVSHHAPFHRKADHVIQISRQNEASKLMRCVDQTCSSAKRHEATGTVCEAPPKRRLQ